MRKASWWILTLVLVVGGVFLYHYHNTGKEDAEKPLTAEGFPIQDAHDMHEEGENLFVVSQKTLYRFNREGDFICQITQSDEIEVAGYLVDAVKEQLIVLGNVNDIYYYTFDGQLLLKKKLKRIDK